jgi:type II restriction enzyme
MIDNTTLLKMANTLIGAKIPKPISGTLSGHAAGEPFDKHVYKALKTQFPANCYRQYEFLNDLYLKNPQVISYQDRQNLFDSPTALFLLSRGKEATVKWSETTPFEEKQNDTADILIVEKNFYEIIDVKTRDISKKAQAPNIISAYKLAQLCALMIDNQEFDRLNITYIEIDWALENDFLVCKNAHLGTLFREVPANLYINWAAAMQIQFHVADLDQSYTGTVQTWAKDYLKHFVNQAKRRAEEMIEKFVKPFEKYLG